MHGAALTVAGVDGGVGDGHVVALVRPAGHVAVGEAEVADTGGAALQHGKARGHLHGQGRDLFAGAAGRGAAVAQT